MGKLITYKCRGTENPIGRPLKDGDDLLYGRNFDPSFNDGEYNSVVVNEALVDFCILTGDVTGMKIDRTTVIGVLKDVSFNSLHNPAEPVVIYLTFEPRG